MNRIFILIIVFLFAITMFACKSDTYEANEYIEEYFSYAFADFENRIDYKEIIHVHYIYVYADPKSDDYGHETRMFDFYINYINDANEQKYDIITVRKENDEDIELITVLGDEIFSVYTDQEMDEVIKSYEKRYSLLKGLSKSFVLESRKMDTSMIDQFLNHSQS